MKTKPSAISEADLSATIIGIDDFSIGFVQTYIAEHFGTDTPTAEQIAVALGKLEEFSGYHGLKINGWPRQDLPSVERMERRLRKVAGVGHEEIGGEEDGDARSVG